MQKPKKKVVVLLYIIKYQYISHTHFDIQITYFGFTEFSICTHGKEQEEFLTVKCCRSVCELVKEAVQYYIYTYICELRNFPINCIFRCSGNKNNIISNRKALEESRTFQKLFAITLTVWKQNRNNRTAIYADGEE